MIDGKDTADYSHTMPALSSHSAEQAEGCKIRPFVLLSEQKWDFAGFSIVTAFPLPLSKQKLLLLHCHTINWQKWREMEIKSMECHYWPSSFNADAAKTSPRGRCWRPEAGDEDFAAVKQSSLIVLRSNHQPPPPPNVGGGFPHSLARLQTVLWAKPWPVVIQELRPH